LALQTYFSVYRPDLPDWVVYVDSSGRMTQVLFHGRDKDSTSRRLRRERYVWTVVFSDAPMKRIVPVPPNTGTLADTADVRVSRRVILSRRDPVLTSLIKGLGKAVGVDPGTEPQAMDSARVVEFRQVSTDSARASLYAAVARLGLTENAQVELALTPVRGKNFPDPNPPSTDTTRSRIESVFLDFVNSREHRFDIGVIVGLTIGPRLPTYNATSLAVTSETPRVSANGYLTGIWNMGTLGRAPAADPFWKRVPVGLFAGTNAVRGSLGDELVGGMVLGNMFGNGGLAIGCSWISAQSIKRGHIVNRFQPRLMAGLELRL
jgi:hypothetical protein